MKKLCLIFAIIAVPILGFSQVKGDTVIIYVDQRAELKIGISDYGDLKSSTEVSEVLSKFLHLLPQFESELYKDKPELVTFNDGVSLTVEPGDPKIIYLLKDGSLSNTGFRDKAVISSDQVHITITTTDLTRLSELSLQECLKDVLEILPKKRSWSKNLYYECFDDETTLLQERNNELDFLEITPGAGIGYINRSFTVDLTLGVGLGLKEKGKVRFPYISSNLLFGFRKGASSTDIGLNLGYGWSKKRGNDMDLVRVELGYVPTYGSGRNTFKLGAYWPIKNVIISPQVYVREDLRKVYPAIRIGYGF